MLRQRALPVLLQGQLIIAEAVEAAQGVRGYAKRRRDQPAWFLAKPRAERDDARLQSRVKRLLREMNGGSPAAAATPAGTSSSGGTASSPTSDASSSSTAAAAPVSSSSGDAPGSSAAAGASGSGGAAPAGSTQPAASGGDSSGGAASTSGREEGEAPATGKAWMSAFIRSLVPGLAPKRAAAGSGSSGAGSSGSTSGTRRASGTPAGMSPLMAASSVAARTGGQEDLAAAAAAASAAQARGLEARQKAQEEFTRAQQKRGEGEPEDPWDSIMLLKDMTLDEYLRNVRSWKGDDVAPLPGVPQRRAFDRERAVYMRWAQHEAIIQVMTSNEQALVRQDPAAAANNRVLLIALAERSGYSPAQVRDVFVNYEQLRTQINAYAAWRESGRPMPDIRDMDGRQEVVKAVKQEKRRAEMDALLARRDRANCPIKPFIRVLGHNASCPNTGLPYAHCCGARADAAVGSARLPGSPAPGAVVAGA